jgi:hypothetical protein
VFSVLGGARSEKLEFTVRLCKARRGKRQDALGSSRKPMPYSCAEAYLSLMIVKIALTMTSYVMTNSTTIPVEKIPAVMPRSSFSPYICNRLLMK